MASIKKIKRKKGTVYKAEVRLTGCEYFSRTFISRAEAQAWAKRMELQLKLSRLSDSDAEAEERLWAMERDVDQLKKDIGKLRRSNQKKNK